MAAPALELDALVVRYGSFTALRGVSARFERGALGLLGPNGAGKSSMLRSILGLVQPAGGTIKLFGESMSSGGAMLRRRVGYMPERDSWIGGVSALRGLTHLAEVCGFLPDDAMLRAHDVLHFVGLGEERYREVHTFSTGMRQRYKLAAALVHDPDLLFLDEPTNGLDPRGRKRMLDLIEQVCHEHGVHLILASHLLPDVERLCNHVWVLDQGEMKRSAPLDELTAAARGAKRVRLAPDEMASFVEAANTAGWMVTQGKKDDEVVVALPDDRELESQQVFAVAANTPCTVLSIQPAARSLEDAFLEALHAPTANQPTSA